MRILGLMLAVFVLALAGCGGDDGGGSADTGTEEQQTTETTETESQSAAAGEEVFTANCGGCHTLGEAGTNGTQGPNLDEAAPDEAAVNRQVTNGGGGMPAFGDKLSTEQIDAVSAYVASVAGQ
jgi:mono/diheme cytochrome c family protein